MYHKVIRVVKKSPITGEFHIYNEIDMSSHNAYIKHLYDVGILKSRSYRETGVIPK